jgi:hypothetical protein
VNKLVVLAQADVPAQKSLATSMMYAPSGQARIVRGVSPHFMDPSEAMRRYDPRRLTPGVIRLADGEQIFFVSTPALGLLGLDRQFAHAPEGEAFDQDLPPSDRGV